MCRAATVGRRDTRSTRGEDTAYRRVGTAVLCPQKGQVMGTRERAGRGATSADARAGEALADALVVVIFLGRGLHQLVVDARGDIVILANFTAGELDFQSLRVFLVTNLGDIDRGNRDPMHREGAPFSRAPVAGEDCPLRASTAGFTMSGGWSSSLNLGQASPRSPVVARG